SRFAIANEQLLFDYQVVVDFVTPPRPRLIFESLDSRSAVRVNYIRAVALRGDRERATLGFRPRVETVHEDHPTRGRCSCGQQQRLIPPGAKSRYLAPPHSSTAL